MSSELILFSTDHCTLCDEALELLLSMPELAGRSVQVVDVAADPELVDRYGEKLPVLEIHQDGTARQLEWPFDAQRVRQAIR